MPNGVDKNLRRLYMACAFYRQRYNEWPSQARVHPIILHDIANLLDQENFNTLVLYLELRTRDKMDLSVGGRGVIHYGEMDHDALDLEVLALAERWLGLELRRDRQHY